MDLSIVIPFYNEEDSIRPLYDAVVDAMSGLSYTYELILVDDGSADETLNKMLEIAKVVQQSVKLTQIQ